MSISPSIKLPPQTQALFSTTFRLPPLDGSLSLPEVWDWLGENCPHHPFFVFARHDGSVRTIDWAEAVRAIHVGSKIIQDRMWSVKGVENNGVIAILASSDSIPYAITVMGIIRANYVAFLLSTRNSPAAIAHLINKVGVKHLLVSGEQNICDLAQDALGLLKTQSSSDQAGDAPEVSSMLTFEELFLPHVYKSAISNTPPYHFQGADAPVVILHSSGSTAFPKPVIWTQRRFLELSLTPLYLQTDLTGTISSLHQLPMFHGMAFASMMRGSSCGIVHAMFEPRSPPLVPTPDMVLRAAQATNCDRISTVPKFLEAWSRNPEYVQWLATRIAVAYGGGPLNKETGDYLVSQGVHICMLYGATEAGAISVPYPSQFASDWEYFEICPQVEVKMLPQGDNTFELVVVASECNHPSVTNMKIDGKDAYATADLVTPHPTLPRYWKILGRADDQIIHSTGEKTNPDPLENILKQDPHVAACVVFGRGRFQAGVVVQPQPEFMFDPADEVRLADFRNKIWSTVEKLNAYAPQHSRLFKEMILVAKPSKPFGFTAKDTVRRGAVIEDYGDEINALYDAVEDSAQSSIPPPTQWDSNTTLAFVRTAVDKVLTVPVKNEDDIFQHGCDSLQATWIRNTILRALRESAKVDTRRINSSFVYEYPTIQRLSSFVLSLASGNASNSSYSISDPATRIDAMRSMAAKYSEDFPTHQANPLCTSPDGDVILLTGTTGGFGCYILTQFVQKREVSQVYAINRASKDGATLRERQRLALFDRGLDVDVLNSDKVVLLEGDLGSADFGLSEGTYQKLRRSVTHIIHNAWRVDFNLALSSFEPNVCGVRALVDFALTSPLSQPPKLVFTSSIGVLQNVDREDELFEAPVGPGTAVSTGYAESKWVSEEILYSARAKSSLRPVVVRVGQLCGGSNGSWNVHEWFPSMVQSAQSLGCFPNDDRSAGVAWIQPEIAANALVDFLTAPDDIYVVHLVHPRPVSWHSLAVPIALECSVDVVPYAEWLKRLEQAVQSTSPGAGAEIQNTMRATQLLPTYKRIGQRMTVGKPAVGMSGLSATKAVSASSTLADPNLRRLGIDEVRAWLAYWRKVGLLVRN